DESILGRLQHNLPVDKFQSLLNIFLSEIEKQISQVHAFLRDQNYEQVEILAHAMKSSTYAFGATRMSYLAKCIEEACQQQQLALVKQYCVFIDNARQETETEFKRKGYARASET
ncbi:MAG: Hpt domain-containing protein, partial [Pararheinheimera sp.]|nr:Hpt domain-containing protein [Rheinheimera sp.]